MGTIGPSIMDLQETLAANQQDFANFVANQSISVLGCDPTCVNDCVNQDFIDFMEIPQCLKYCPCDGGNVI